MKGNKEMTLGQTAYDAYISKLGIKEPTPFEELPADLRAAWQAGAEAVRKELGGGKVSGRTKAPGSAADPGGEGQDPPAPRKG